MEARQKNAEKGGDNKESSVMAELNLTYQDASIFMPQVRTLRETLRCNTPPELS
jgi:hypothetical protein